MLVSFAYLSSYRTSSFGASLGSDCISDCIIDYEMKVVRHFPVMLSNVIKRLKHIAEQPEKKNAMLDCTLGTGGHTLGLLEQYPNLYMYAESDRTDTASISTSG